MNVYNMNVYNMNVYNMNVAIRRFFFSSFFLFLSGQYLFSALISFRMLNKFTLTSYKVKVTV